MNFENDLHILGSFFNSKKIWHRKKEYKGDCNYPKVFTYEN